MQDCVLVTLADGNYVEQAKQLFSSVYWNAGWQGDYLLLAVGITEADSMWFRDRGILVRECEPFATNTDRYVGHAPLTTLCKLQLFTLEFRRWKNVVFLDGDVIVRGSLETLARVEGFGAVRILNVFRTLMKGQFHDRKAKNALLFEELERTCNLDRPAFNAGMMAFSTDILAGDDFQKLRELFYRFREILFISEETVLNIYFQGMWRELSQVYNVCPSYEMFLSGCRIEELKGIVLHAYSNFPGGKPWKPKSPLNAEWKLSLDQAGRIDPGHSRAPKILLSKSQENARDSYLKNLHRRHFIKFYRYKISRDLHSRVRALKHRLF